MGLKTLIYGDRARSVLHSSTLEKQHPALVDANCASLEAILNVKKRRLRFMKRADGVVRVEPGANTISQTAGVTWHNLPSGLSTVFAGCARFGRLGGRSLHLLECVF